MVSNELKNRIVVALAGRREYFSGSDAKFAVSIGINHAQYSRIKKGDTDKVLSDANWISLARILEISINDSRDWNVAETPVYHFIMEQLAFCQNNSASRLLCDSSDIGKTFIAKYYARKITNAVYIDCSQVKTKQKLIRQIAKEFGINYSGRYSDVYADLTFYLRSIHNPLVILDEAGDLDYQAFLELKALWNATERACGYYMMGADGLEAKIKRSIDHRKVGYTEMFSRFGNRYQKATPESTHELYEFKRVLAAMIIKANTTEGEVNMRDLIARSDSSLRRIYDELRKLKRD